MSLTGLQPSALHLVTDLVRNAPLAGAVWTPSVESMTALMILAFCHYPVGLSLQGSDQDIEVGLIPSGLFADDELEAPLGEGSLAGCDLAGGDPSEVCAGCQAPGEPLLGIVVRTVQLLGPGDRVSAVEPCLGNEVEPLERLAEDLGDQALERFLPQQPVVLQYAFRIVCHESCTSKPPAPRSASRCLRELGR